MSSSWRDTTVGECLQDEFPGDWGEGPERGWNALVLRSTNLDDDGHVNLSTAAPRKIAPSKLSAKALRPGDILLEASGGGPGKPVGRVAGFNGPSSKFIVSNFFRTLRPNSSVSAEFLAWRLQHLYVQPEIWRYQQQTTGIINLKVKEYLEHTIMLPPAREQRRIAEILDTVDEAIRSTEAVIRKLEQVKRGLLHDLLTRGIDDNGELRDPERHPEQFKDSPLGRIPREWDVRALGELVDSAIDGPFGSNLKSSHYVDAGIRVVRLQNVGNGHFDDSDKAYISPKHARTLARHNVVGGDLLVASLGDENHPIARACLYPSSLEEGIVKADCFRLRPSRGNEAGFLMMALNCPVTRVDINGLAQGVTRDRVNLGNLKTVRVPVPSHREQVECHSAFMRVVRKIEEERETADKLRLLKTGLMDDLLTGRVRVSTGEEPG